jgi:uncharacterized membrane protein YkvA (DUF1232 family)
VKRTAAGPRRGARRTLLAFIKRIPAYLRLLGGLITDRRVSALDKALVGLAIAYVVSPLDFIPDFIPFFGEVDDVFLLGLALQRLISRAGRRVVLSHWDGDPSELDDSTLHRMLRAASFFLPGGVAVRVRRLLARSGRPVGASSG